MLGIGSSYRRTYREAGGDVAAVVTLPKPPIASVRVEVAEPPKSDKVGAVALHPARSGFIAEYAELAALVGIAPPDLILESFREFLRAQDWPVFPLAQVVAYMDQKAAAESRDQAGWQWRPLREKDHMLNAEFGVPATRTEDQFGRRTGAVNRPASDYYRGPHEYDTSEHVNQNGNWQQTGRTIKARGGSSQSPYDKTIPLHALRKVAAIERGFTAGPVSFFVCDYAPAPQIEHPDPFLMAAINNPKLGIGVGRFILDFWDEPGFGMEQMLGHK